MKIKKMRRAEKKCNMSGGRAGSLPLTPRLWRTRHREGHPGGGDDDLLVQVDADHRHGADERQAERDERPRSGGQTGAVPTGHGGSGDHAEATREPTRGSEHLFEEGGNVVAAA